MTDESKHSRSRQVTQQVSKQTSQKGGVSGDLVSISHMQSQKRRRHTLPSSCNYIPTLFSTGQHCMVRRDEIKVKIIVNSSKQEMMIQVTK